ncbi:MAG TPA: hypothetical protein VG406_03640 [Isosphaeraceae bacterium]|nr:hypothetical protein [Isosphaeraceae bacterium]
MAGLGGSSKGSGDPPGSSPGSTRWTSRPRGKGIVAGIVGWSDT